MERLTRREVEVLLLAMDGLSNAQIAERLVIQPNTAKLHMHHISGKITGDYETRSYHRGLVAALIKGGWLVWTEKRL